MEQHRAQNRVESLHKTHLLVVAHAQFISREVTKKIIEATEFGLFHYKYSTKFPQFFGMSNVPMIVVHFTIDWFKIPLLWSGYFTRKF